MYEDIEQYEDWLNENDEILIWSDIANDNIQGIRLMKKIYKECAEYDTAF